MSIIQVHGLQPLKGEVGIQGSKNAVLPMMAASILHRGTVVLTHVPRIQDVYCMKGILEYMGCECTLEGDRLTIHTDALTDIHIPEKYLKAMRSSIMMLGGLLGRCKEAVTCYPGGCSIGERPIDLHLYALRTLGAEVEERDGVIRATAGRLQGGEIDFSFPSVGATENALLAAVLAEGITVIRGAAREPEIMELCTMLNSMGAKVTGGGSEVIRVEGVKGLHDTVFEVPGDRIAAGTYLSCIMASQGEAVLTGVCPRQMTAVLCAVKDMGAEIKEYDKEIAIAMKGRPKAVNLKTEPYPGFPTDLQSPMLSLLAIGEGTGSIRETIFEGRFATAYELRKMGANIRVEEEKALAAGTYPLTGCPVEASDLRGGAALVVAGLAAEGDTIIRNCGHILRGYEDICRDLQKLGADIRRIL
ncbi:MAG: UDP-N-acetylglucosamine 1-carboxyvinyltransferase [Hungatella sp.]|nr:UDP-N-acetylglucosamine 1-carboxyvinyltransferase [Hungatella sp.]